jgi:ornithine cyclodeaminase/alanine dehydrogenase-like protein (mu-crystallin family)
MHVLQARDLSQVLDYAALVDALDAAFRGDATVPPRHHHTVPVADGRDATLLLMPAWDANYLGIKTATVMPENGALDLLGVHANYQLLDRRTGDICDLLIRGVITDADILGTLFTLARGEAPAARPTGNEITFFKSAGTAIEDLAGAVLAYERTRG